MRPKNRFFQALAVFIIVCAILITGAALLNTGNSSAIGATPFGGAEAGYIDIEGVITASDSDSSGFGGGSTASSMKICKELKELAEDKSIKGVIIRIDSPGGSAAASDEIWHAIKNFPEDKKVVVSMGDVAASGGYYIATAADYIYANPSTLTGSIGVIFEGMEFSGLFEKLGITTTTIKSGKDKDIGSPYRPMTDEEKTTFQGLLDSVHEQFIARVAEGRKLDVEAVRKIATGMVFTGEQALDKKLIDGIGGFDDAFKKLEELSKESLTLREPPTPSFWEFLMNPKAMTPLSFSSEINPLSYIAQRLFLNEVLAEYKVR